MSLKRNLKFIVVCLAVVCMTMPIVQAQYSSGLTVTTNPDGALVTLNGDAIVTGVTPTKFTHTLVGLYKITIERYGYEKYNTKVILDPSKQMELNINLTPKTRFKSAVRSLVIPGWGQRYSSQNKRGYLYTFLAAASVWGYFVADDDFDTKYDRFKSLEAEYDNLKVTGTVSQMEELLPRLTYAQDRAYDAENVRRTVIGAAIAVWSLSVLDALFFFPEEKGTFRVKNLTVTPETNFQNVGVNLSYHF